MRDLVRRLGLRGAGGRAPASFAPSFKPSFGITKSILATPSQATASFLQFDGASTVVEWSTGPSTAADGQAGTFVVPFNRKGGSGAECILYIGTTTGESVFIGFDSTNHLVARISDGALTPTAILTLTSTSTYNDSVNRVAIFSYDLDTIGGSAFYWLYVNDTNETGTPAAGTAADIDLTDKWRIGSTDNSASRQWYSGATGHILFYPEVFPLPDANTRKYFYDAALDGPVDHGADGSAALGDVPPLYWATDAAAATTNKGDGGNASSASTFSDAASPPNLASLPAFAANAVQFDDLGASGEWINYGAPLPADDTKLFIMMSWKRDVALSLDIPFCIAPSTSNLRLQMNADNTFSIFLQNGAAARWTGAVSGLSVSDTSGWHTYLMCCDAATFTTTNLLANIFDGTSYSMATSPTGAGALALNDSPFGLGHQDGNTTRNFDGALAECLVAVPSAYIDLTSAAELAKYYSGGKPVFQGLTGMKNLGVRPLFYMRSNAAMANLNVGSLAHGTITGALSDAASSPTD